MNKPHKPEYHKKGWGYELWIHNNTDYCGKLLFFKEGKKCSFHYHKKKSETFYIQSGKLLVKFALYAQPETIEEVLLTAGDAFEVPPYVVHQMEAVEDTELFEFSTQHFEEDSIRVLKGD